MVIVIKKTKSEPLNLLSFSVNSSIGLIKDDPHEQPFEAPDRNVEFLAAGAGAPQKMVLCFP